MEIGVIKPAQSELGSHIILVLKNKTFRFCVDYLRLNATSMPDTNLLPRKNDCIASLKEEKMVIAVHKVC